MLTFDDPFGTGKRVPPVSLSPMRIEPGPIVSSAWTDTVLWFKVTLLLLLLAPEPRLLLRCFRVAPLGKAGNCARIVESAIFSADCTMASLGERPWSPLIRNRSPPLMIFC